MSISKCCLSGIDWEGTPGGRIDKLAEIDTYVAGDNPDIAILLIHDLFGWAFPNIRLLADHYAREANVTVYVADFFHGDALPTEPLAKERWSELDLPGFMKKNSREIREPGILGCARALRAAVGAIGFCYGGWAVFRLGAKEHQPPLVDCITAGHPSLLTKKDIDEVAVPVQILAPEMDPAFTSELKAHSFETIQKLRVPFDYQYFPRVVHACFVRGDPENPGEREAMARGKNAAVSWWEQFLYAT